MNKTFVSLVILFIVGGSLLVFQASRQKTSLVLNPKDLVQAESEKADLNRIRVGGRVAPLPISYTTEPLRLSFSIIDREGGPNSVKVIYDGVKPDMFEAGRDVLIDGDFKQDTLFASKLLTQCPSKYEPPRPVRPTDELKSQSIK